jgi:hypothetical protein
MFTVSGDIRNKAVHKKKRKSGFVLKKLNKRHDQKDY